MEVKKPQVNQREAKLTEKIMRVLGLGQDETPALDDLLAALYRRSATNQHLSERLRSLLQQSLSDFKPGPETRKSLAELIPSATFSELSNAAWVLLAGANETKSAVQARISSFTDQLESLGPLSPAFCSLADERLGELLAEASRLLRKSSANLKVVKTITSWPVPGNHLLAPLLDKSLLEAAGGQDGGWMLAIEIARQILGKSFPKKQRSEIVSFMANLGAKLSVGRAPEAVGAFCQLLAELKEVFSETDLEEVARAFSNTFVLVKDKNTLDSVYKALARSHIKIENNFFYRSGASKDLPLAALAASYPFVPPPPQNFFDIPPPKLAGLGRFIAEFLAASRDQKGQVPEKFARSLASDPFTNRTIAFDSLTTWECSVLLEAIGGVTKSVEKALNDRPADLAAVGLLTALLLLGSRRAPESLGGAARLGFSGLSILACAEPREERLRGFDLQRLATRALAAREFSFQTPAELERSLVLCSSVARLPGRNQTLSSPVNAVFWPGAALALRVDNSLMPRLAALFSTRLLGSLASKAKFLERVSQVCVPPKRSLITKAHIEALDRFGFTWEKTKIEPIDKEEDVLAWVEKHVKTELDPEEARLEEAKLRRSAGDLSERTGRILSRVASAVRLNIEISSDAELIPLFEAVSETVSVPELTKFGPIIPLCVALCERLEPKLPGALAARALSLDLAPQAITTFEKFSAKWDFKLAAKSPFASFTLARALFHYAINSGADPTLKRRYFDLVAKLAQPDRSLQFLSFATENLNSLYFADLPSAFQTLASEAVKSAGCSDALLGPLPLLEEFALKIVLETVLKLGALLDPASAASKLKLLIAAEHENPEIRGLAVNASTLPPLRFATGEKPKLQELAAALPPELRSQLGIAYAKICAGLEPKARTDLITSILDEFAQAPQTTAPLFLEALSPLASMFDDAAAARCLRLTFAAEKSARELSIATACAVVKARPKWAAGAAESAREGLASGGLAPLAVLGEAAALGASCSGVEQKVLAMLERPEPELHLALARTVRTLLPFFSDPRARIEESLAAARASPPDAAKPRLLFAAGMAVALGARKLLELDFVGRASSVLSGGKRPKEIEARERYWAAALLESLWAAGGRLAEPLAPSMLEPLLPLAGDLSENVRAAATATVEAMLADLSEFSIGRILPTLLSATKDKNARAKLAALGFLGAVSKCGVRQLGRLLPTVVPALTAIANDPDENVKAASVRSLSSILATVKNPEVSALREPLIRALADPYLHNSAALDALMHVSFAHFVDGAALALVAPVLLYGLSPGSPDAEKEKAGRVLVALVGMVAREEEFAPVSRPLVEALMNPLREIRPEVRAVAAKALAALAGRFRSVRVLVADTIRAVLEGTTAGNVERAGAAQAFAELLGLAEKEERSATIEATFALARDSREHLRESFLAVLVYAPMVLGEAWRPWAAAAVEAAGESLGHSKERFRALAVKAIKSVVSLFVDKHIDYLIEAFSAGALSQSSLRRYSALLLLGDVAENLHVRHGTRMWDVQPRLFALLYICKSDPDEDARAVAQSILKAFAPNIQRALRSVASSLIACLLEMNDRGDTWITELVSGGTREFIEKYGDDYLLEIIAQMESRSKEKPGSPGPRILAHFLVLFFPRAALKPERRTAIRDYLLRRAIEGTAEDSASSLADIRLLADATGDWKPAFSLATAAADALDAGISGTESERHVALLLELTRSRQQKLVESIARRTLVGFPRSWQLEVINARVDIFSEMLFEPGPLERGLRFFLNALPGGDMRPALLACAANVASKVEGRSRIVLLEELENYLRESIKQGGSDLCDALDFFGELVTRTQPSQLAELQPAASLVVPLIAYTGPTSATVHSSIAKFLAHSFEFIPEESAPSFLSAVFVALEETVRATKRFEGLLDSRILSALFGLCVRVLNSASCEAAIVSLQCLKFLVVGVPRAALLRETESLGPAIARALCRGLLNQAFTERILTLLNAMLERGVLSPASFGPIAIAIGVRLGRGEIEEGAEKAMKEMLLRLGKIEGVRRVVGRSALAALPADSPLAKAAEKMATGQEVSSDSI